MPTEPPAGRFQDVLHVASVCVVAADAPALRECLLAWPRDASIVGIIRPATEQDHAAVEAAMAGVPSRVEPVDGAPAGRGTVLLAPPGLTVHIVDAHVRVLPAEPTAPTVWSTLRRLASDHGPFAIAVVLAGAVDSAWAGIRAVKESGGLVIAEGSAKQTPAGSGVALIADFVLPAGELAPALARYLPRQAVLDPGAAASVPTQADLERIVAIIGSQTGVDFGEYKQTTLVRRIERRMSVNQIPDALAYIDLLQQSPHEVMVLHREMLIGVTRFFRDPEAFASLVQGVVPLLAAKASAVQPARVWVAGCSTGEEAYSVAIVICDAFERIGKPLDVKVFATDLDRQAVEFASIGRYPDTIAADIPPDLLARYFTRHDDQLQIVKRVRELMVFAPHNIIKDPPFYKIDLVTCRNLMIYLKPGLQRKLLGSFHFAINPEGWMMLGPSESLGEISPYFASVDMKWKIFQKKPGKRLPLMGEDLFAERARMQPSAIRSSRPDAPSAGGESLQDAIAQTLLREFLPAFLVVDEHFEILHVSGEVGRYLTMPPGKPTYNLVKLAPRELAVAISTGVRRALADNEVVVFDDIAVDSERAWKVRLVVRPFLQRQDLGRLVVVAFDEATAAQPTPGSTFDLASQTDQRIKDLEFELEQTGESLQAAIEELETSNEELQATNEEVLAANEELQSTNEELQSVNEELYSVNAECQAQIAELSELNNDILNFLGSTSIGTVFLDPELRVRKFTQAVTAQINLIDKDIGRPLEHLSNNIGYVDLVADARAVLADLTPRQREVGTPDGRWHLMRMLPYRTSDDVIKGVVITFIDISELKAANERVRNLTMVVESSASLAMITDAAGAIQYVNQRFTEVTGWPGAEVIGRNPRFLRGDGEDPLVFAAMWRELAAGRRWSGRFRNRTRTGGAFTEDAVIVPMFDADRRILSYIKMATVDSRHG